MRPMPALAYGCFLLILEAVPALAFRPPDTNAPMPTEHQQDLRYADTPTAPYAMNYADEAAQRLGVHDGRWEAFDTQSTDPLVPSFKGGVDSGGAMFKLQWAQ
jgi:hypothetical protein